MSEKFTFFWNGPFSQWHPSSFEIDGIRYNCAEQYMMAEKARMFEDSINLAHIMTSVKPKDQKAYGRKVVGFNKAIWDKEAKNIVYKGNYAKFNQNLDLKKKLLATEGTTLVEASPVDCIWGIGLKADDPRARQRETWLGTNWLGETLTKVRDNIIKEKSC